MKAKTAYAGCSSLMRRAPSLESCYASRQRPKQAVGVRAPFSLRNSWRAAGSGRSARLDAGSRLFFAGSDFLCVGRESSIARCCHFTPAES